MPDLNQFADWACASGQEGRGRSTSDNALRRKRLRSGEAVHDLRRGITGGIDFMLTRTIGRFFVWPIDRLAALLAPTGIPPNVITWSALILNLWGGILFAAGGVVGAGGGGGSVGRDSFCGGSIRGGRRDDAAGRVV